MPANSFFVIDPTVLVLLLVCGAVTLLNRLGGHYILRRFEPIPYRVEAALEAVPMAVISSIVVPGFIMGGTLERITIILAGLLGLKLSFYWAGSLALLFLAVGRSLLGA